VTSVRDALAAQDDFDIEPVEGLPEALPEGERVLWAGTPSARALSFEVFHIRAVAIYALVILVWRFSVTLYDGGTVGAAMANTAFVGLIFLIGIALLGVLAWATARSTRYTITTKRVVMRIGVALTMSVNLPFRQITSADYRAGPFGTGSIALTLAANGKLGYAALWPHVRPFHLSRPQPMLRGIRDGEAAARILGTALAASRGVTAPKIHVTARTSEVSHPVSA